MQRHQVSSGKSITTAGRTVHALFARAVMLKAAAPARRAKPQQQDQPRDADGDGKIYDGTPQEQPVQRKLPEQHAPRPVAQQRQGRQTAQPTGPQAGQGAPQHRFDPAHQAKLDTLVKSQVLFKDEEINIGFGAKQPAKTQHELFAQAKACYSSFTNALNHGQGVDKAIGGTSLYPDSIEAFHTAIDTAVETKKPVVIIGHLKSEKRAAEKVEAKYAGDWSRLRDVVRATVAVPSAETIPQTIEAIRTHMAKSGWSLAETPDNRMENPLDTAYRDIMTLWKGPNGHVAELQINTLRMIKAKEGRGHKIYEKYRVVAESITRAKRQATPEEVAQLSAMRDEMKRLYQSAWR